MIVNTRPRLLSGKLVELSNNLNLEILNAHLSEIVSLDLGQDFQSSAGYLNKISAYKNIIFTSQASAEIGLRILQKKQAEKGTTRESKINMDYFFSYVFDI